MNMGKIILLVQALGFALAIVIGETLNILQAVILLIDIVGLILIEIIDMLVKREESKMEEL